MTKAISILAAHLASLAGATLLIAGMLAIAGEDFDQMLLLLSTLPSGLFLWVCRVAWDVSMPLLGAG